MSRVDLVKVRCVVCGRTVVVYSSWYSEAVSILTLSGVWHGYECCCCLPGTAFECGEVDWRDSASVLTQSANDASASSPRSKP
jgi:hypothetical protein